MNDLTRKVSLGGTGVEVSRLGIGSAYGVSERACRMAFDEGVNYFFWGSVRTPGMGKAIRDIARTQRDDLVVVLECYVRQAGWIPKSVEVGLRNLKIEQADVLLLGWYDRPPSPRVLNVVEGLKEKGRFRFLGISTHQRPLFKQYLKDGRYDVFHVRYNAAHRGAEQEVFPFLPESEGPGIVSFTNTRWGDLLDPKKMPAGVSSPPTAPDCYRFVLSHPAVQVAICGPKNDDEMAAGLSALKAGPMGEEELERMRLIGDHVHGISSAMSFLT
jgi:aryl-alcohol dehydrogenase-like predicted oxidoreductase